MPDRVLLAVAASRKHVAGQESKAVVCQFFSWHATVTSLVILDAKQLVLAAEQEDYTVPSAELVHAAEQEDYTVPSAVDLRLLVL